VRMRQPLGTAGFFLFAVLLAAFVCGKADAQDRWPPWQSYSQAEKAARAKAKRRAVPKQSQINALNAQAAKLRQAGKIDKAIVVAKRALNLTQRRHGRNHVATAAALTTLAELLIEKKRYAQAEPLLKRALAIRKRSKNKKEIARALDNLAKLYAKQGRKAQAKQMADRAGALRGEKAVPSGRVEKREGGGVATKEAKPKVTAAKKAMEEAEAKSAAKAAKPRAMHPKRRAYHRKAPPLAGGAPSASKAAPPAPEAMRAPAGAAKSMEEPAPATPAAAPPPPPAKQEKWDVVPVFFGTDRAEEANPKRLSYSSDRGHRLELGRALVTVPKLHEVPQIERPWAIRIPYFNVTIYEEAEDPNKHFTLQEIKKLSKEGLLKLVRERLAKSDRFKDQALVFVHGYNTSFDNAVYRTAQIAYDLKFDGAPFLYSWPSGGAVASYTYDRESAEASKPYMRRFLEMVVKETGAKAVSIIAHSMGNQPLLGVLKDMKASAPEGVEISQIILAAPDVDADSFSNLAHAIEGMAKGVTLYAASNDRALIVSRNFWGHARAGDVPDKGPLVLPGIDTIDVTAASTDVFALNHSGYAQNTKVLDDIGELIETGKRPPEQRELAPARVTTDHGDYWRYDMPTGSP
jgi:esterase/lipase superfamily enzyme